MLYLPALIFAAVLMACAAALLALSEKAEATFPGKNGRIAYTDWDSGKDYEIYTINPDGSGKRQLTHNNTDDLDPAYSPDGKKIVYAGQDGPKGDLEISSFFHTTRKWIDAHLREHTDGIGFSPMLRNLSAVNPVDIDPF
jgi:WD40-like Beta Propeller Repeat